MGKNKLISTEFAISLLEEERIENPYEKIKFETIAKKARTYGYNIEGRILRRDQAFRDRLFQINQEILACDDEDNVHMIAFKSFDAEKLIRNNTGTENLIKQIQQRDEYYKKICIYANKVLNENKELKSRLKTLDDIKRLKERVSQLTKFIDKYINPSIANELLKKEGIIEAINSYVDPSVIEVIDANSDISNVNLRKMANAFKDETKQ